MAKSRAVINPNLGLYTDRANIALDRRMLQDGFNFRIKEGRPSNLNLGWTRFEPDITLNGPVRLIDNFFIRGATEKLIFGTDTDLYVYDAAGHTVDFITPQYDAGTAAASGTAVTGTGTDWDPNVKAGDEIHFGDANFTDPLGTWFLILTRNSDTSLTLTTSAGTVADGPYTIRKKFTGDACDIWVTDTFVNASPSTEDEWWATNGTDTIVRWNGTDLTVEEMSGSLGFTCKVLRVYSNMLIFGNLTQGGTVLPTDIINSNVGEPQNVTSGLSEQFKVHGGIDPIANMLPIGDTLTIYSGLEFAGRLTVAQFVGDPLIFTFRHAVTAIGPIAVKALADYGDYHTFIGHDSQYQFDGATAKETSRQVWRDFIRQQDPVRTCKTFAFFDDENGDLIWVMPSTVDPGSGDEASPPSRAVGEHYLEEVGDHEHPHSLRRFAFTAQGYFTQASGLTWDQLTEAWNSYNFSWNDKFFFAAFPLILVGDSDGKIYTLNTSQDGDGVALPSFHSQDGRPRPGRRFDYPDGRL